MSAIVSQRDKRTEVAIDNNLWQIVDEIEVDLRQNGRSEVEIKDFIVDSLNRIIKEIEGRYER